MTTDEYRHPGPKPEEYVPMVRFLEELGLSELEFDREVDPGREIEF